MERFLVIVECAIEYQGRFLFIKRPQGVHAEGLLAFPGGKVEYQDGLSSDASHNILAEAAKREIFEEVGLDLVDPLHFVTSSYFIDSHNNEHVLDVIFHCKLLKTKLNINASEREVPEYYWLTPAEASMNKHTPIWLKQYIDCIIKGNN